MALRQQRIAHAHRELTPAESAFEEMAQYGGRTINPSDTEGNADARRAHEHLRRVRDAYAAAIRAVDADPTLNEVGKKLGYERAARAAIESNEGLALTKKFSEPVRAQVRRLRGEAARARPTGTDAIVREMQMREIRDNLRGRDALSVGEVLADALRDQNEMVVSALHDWPGIDRPLPRKATAQAHERLLHLSNPTLSPLIAELEDALSTIDSEAAQLEREARKHVGGESVLDTIARTGVDPRQSPSCEADTGGASAA